MRPVDDPGGGGSRRLTSEGFAWSALTAYWQNVKDETKQPAYPDWAPGAMTDEWAPEIGSTPQGKINGPLGLTGSYRFAVPPQTATYVVQLQGGWYLACSSIIEQLTLVAPAQHRISQSAAREEWGPDVPPGAYRAIIQVDEYTPCIQFSPASLEAGVNGVTPPDEVTSIGVP